MDLRGVGENINLIKTQCANSQSYLKKEEKKKPERALEVIRQLCLPTDGVIHDFPQVWHLPGNLHDVTSVLTNEQLG